MSSIIGFDSEEIHPEFLEFINRVQRPINSENKFTILCSKLWTTHFNNEPAFAEFFVTKTDNNRINLEIIFALEYFGIRKLNYRNGTFYHQENESKTIVRFPRKVITVKYNNDNVMLFVNQRPDEESTELSNLSTFYLRPGKMNT